MKVHDFDLAQTLECGQCFNFEKIAENEYVVVTCGRLLHARQEADELILDASEEEIRKIWVPYFDLERDYAEIKEAVIGADGRLKEAVKTYGGIHILNQEFEETLISFIISQNSNIPRIKGIVRMISERCGRKIGTFAGKEYYAFPTPAELAVLSEEDFRELKTGFRAPYLKGAADFLSEHPGWQDALRGMSYEEAKAELVKLKGVGEKVADCVLLFGLGFREAFPVDVWIKRICEELYFGRETGKDVIARMAAERFGKWGGYAQQYLFIYARNKG